MQRDRITVKRSRRYGDVRITVGDLVVTVQPWACYGRNTLDATPTEQAIGSEHATVWVGKVGTQTPAKPTVAPVNPRVARVKDLWAIAKARGITKAAIAKQAGLAHSTVLVYLANPKGVGDFAYERLRLAVMRLAA